MLLDLATHDLAPVAGEVLERLGGDPRFKLELPAAQLEIATSPKRLGRRRDRKARRRTARPRRRLRRVGAAGRRRRPPRPRPSRGSSTAAPATSWLQRQYRGDRAAPARRRAAGPRRRRRRRAHARRPRRAALVPAGTGGAGGQRALPRRPRQRPGVDPADDLPAQLLRQGAAGAGVFGAVRRRAELGGRRRGAPQPRMWWWSCVRTPPSASPELRVPERADDGRLSGRGDRLRAGAGGDAGRPSRCRRAAARGADVADATSWSTAATPASPPTAPPRWWPATCWCGSGSAGGAAALRTRAAVGGTASVPAWIAVGLLGAPRPAPASCSTTRSRSAGRAASRRHPRRQPARRWCSIVAGAGLDGGARSSPEARSAPSPPSRPGCSTATHRSSAPVSSTSPCSTSASPWSPGFAAVALGHWLGGSRSGCGPGALPLGRRRLR